MDENKTFELRRLRADDLFPMFAILSKIGFKEIKAQLDPATIGKLTAMFKGSSESIDDLRYSVGMSVTLDAAQVIVSNIPKCKKDLYMLLSQVSGIPEKKIGELDLPVFAEMIVAFIQKDEFKDFFSAASKLFKSAT